ncbi:hypothetical protein [Mucilaginibacter aquariorum]|uniref:NERD domain-containing protein n=1 Tax=Mucilaginibacter aquariorum TaxID=2967225 RepID=A0ABT1SZG1_9SPHI|nr:hypothetical protein [Mucilaginibacter aquariorum]MCQ6957724.1 hypothetical protein [Mucilaginibacter aquariorum]
MKQPEISIEEGQRRINEVFENLPQKMGSLLEDLKDKATKFESLQLISNISHYNHLRDTRRYSDYNDGRMAVIAELVSILCLKIGYIDKCEITTENINEKLKELQDVAAQYFGMFSLNHSNNRLGEETTLQRITNKLNRDEIVVRNPGLIEHHYMIVEQLFKELNPEIKKQFGFDINDSLVIRKSLIKLFQNRIKIALDSAHDKTEIARLEVLKFRNTGSVTFDGLLSVGDLNQLKPFSSKKLKNILLYHYMNEIYYNLSSIYAFTAGDLANHCQVSVEIAENFLKPFACEFGSIKENIEILGALTILRTKPVIKKNDKYIIPSFSLLTWAVEPTIEDYFKQYTKLSNKFKDIKHDYLLSFSIELLSTMMPNAQIYPSNLYYTLPDGKRCEADGLIGYDTTLFVIEAKGSRITNKAKDGSYERTENHLKELIRDATLQGQRTINFIKNSENASFRNKKNQSIDFDPTQYDEFVLVSLTLEPIGNITPLLKVNNDLEYFDEHQFPLILSIYDLIVMVDHFEHPVFFLHYLKRRKRFLEVQKVYVFEEIDLMGYYLANGLYIENSLRRAEEGNINVLSFDNQTDEINDYYMYKFGHKEQFTPKVKSFHPEDFIALLNAIEASKIQHRVKIMSEFLEFNSDSIRTLIDNVHKVKKQFSEDGDLHDCSICSSKDGGGVGITFMTASNQTQLDEKLYHYCLYKLHQVKAKIWVGIGDINTSTDNYNIKCSFFAMSNN